VFHVAPALVDQKPPPKSMEAVAEKLVFVAMELGEMPTEGGVLVDGALVLLCQVTDKE
jgi:hypothetical protein